MKRISLVALLLCFFFCGVGSVSAEGYLKILDPDKMVDHAKKGGGQHAADVKGGNPNWPRFNENNAFGEFAPGFQEQINELRIKFGNLLQENSGLKDKISRLEEANKSLGNEVGKLTDNASAIKLRANVLSAVSALLILLVLTTLFRRKQQDIKLDAQDFMKAIRQPSQSSGPQSDVKEKKGPVMLVVTGQCTGGRDAALELVTKALANTNLSKELVDAAGKCYYSGNLPAGKKNDPDFTAWIDARIKEVLQQANGEEVYLVFGEELTGVGAVRMANRVIVSFEDVKSIIIGIGIKDGVTTPLFSLDNHGQCTLPNIVKPEVDKKAAA